MWMMLFRTSENLTTIKKTEMDREQMEFIIHQYIDTNGKLCCTKTLDSAINLIKYNEI